MYQHRESGFTGHGNEPRYRLTSSLQFEPVVPKGELRDPLHEFFSPKYASIMNKGIATYIILLDDIINMSL